MAIGTVPLAANAIQQILGVDESLAGLFRERHGTEFGGPHGRPITPEESLAAVRRLYDGAISTGRPDDGDVVVVADRYIQNLLRGWLI